MGVHGGDTTKEQGPDREELVFEHGYLPVLEKSQEDVKVPRSAECTHGQRQPPFKPLQPTIRPAPFQRDLSPDWHFGIACDAALKLCPVILDASGYRPGKGLALYGTLAALALIFGVQREQQIVTGQIFTAVSEKETAAIVHITEALV